VNMCTGLLILILEQSNMVGILKSLGASDTSLSKIFLIEAFDITLRGILWGNLIGFGICIAEYYGHFIPLDEASYYLSYVPIHFSWVKLVLISLFTLIMSTLTMYIPVLFTKKIDAIKVIEFR
jgi:lipoprotein-releasing system permease protein